jgi:hypothetical protein
MWTRVAPAVLGVAVLVAAGSCSSSTENRVEVVEGDPATTTVPSGPATTLDLGDPTLTDDVEVSTVGIGDVRFGMTVEEAQEAAGTELERQDGGTETCWVVVPREAPEGVSFVVQDGKVERVDIAAAGVETPSGAGVGMSQSELEALFPDRLQGVDVLGGRQYTFVPNDPGEADLRIIFLTDGNQVVSYKAGRTPLVEAPGC